MPKVSVYRGRTHLFDHWVEKPLVVIGRSAEADIPLDSPAASRKHCRIVRRQAAFMLEEMGAKNGLFVNGQFCNVHRLQDGDTIEIADHILVFHRPPSEVREEEIRAQGRAGSNLRIGQHDLDRMLDDRKGASGELRQQLKQQDVGATSVVAPGDLERLLAEAKKKQMAHLQIEGPQGHLRVPLEKTKTTLGFVDGLDVVLPVKRLWPWGQRAAEIRALSGGEFQLSRLSPWVLIKINGERLGEVQSLQDKDMVQIGPASMRYLAATGAALSKRKRR